MIQALKIQNFQSHKNTEITFQNNVNIFVGYSDSGKTAILRALRWVITNRPGGDAFRSNWGGDTVVEIFLDNGTKVGRVKGNSRNEYLLQVEGEEVLIFRAFGTDVPSEIKDALMFTDVNIQHQLDAPYLLSETPGHVAKHFNKIAKLEKIDKGIQVVQSKIQSFGQGVKTNEINITTYKEAYKSYKYIGEFEIELTRLENKIISKDEVFGDIIRLSNIIKDLKDTQFAQIDYKEIIQFETPINSLIYKFDKKRDLHTNFRRIEGFISMVKQLLTQKKVLQAEIDSEVLVKQLLEYYKELNAYMKVVKSISNLVQSINTVQQSQEIALKSLKEKEKDFKDNFPTYCPLCNSKIK